MFADVSKTALMLVRRKFVGFIEYMQFVRFNVVEHAHFSI